jgi:hypothetical protein
MAVSNPERLNHRIAPHMKPPVIAMVFRSLQHFLSVLGL